MPTPITVDWSIVMGIAIGLGIPGIGFTISAIIFIVRMESRTTVLENHRLEDVRWRAGVDTKLDSIRRELDRFLGDHSHHRKLIHQTDVDGG